MTDLESQLRAFALAHGGTYRTGPQPRKPIDPSIGQSQPVQKPVQPLELSDVFIEWTDDYSLWCRVKRGE